MSQLNVLHLAYHEVKSPAEARPAAITTTPERLEAQIDWLANEHYDFMTCGEFAAVYSEGRLSNKVVTLSFDDGFQDGGTTVRRILETKGVRATFFIPTCTLRGKVPKVIKFQQLLGKLLEDGDAGIARLANAIKARGIPHWRLFDPEIFKTGDLYANEIVEVRRAKAILNQLMPPALAEEVVSEMFATEFGSGAEKALLLQLFMGPKMVREMHEAGMEMASHSVTHPYLPLVSMGELESELVGSIADLRAVRGEVKGETFGWPFGGVFSETTQEVVGRHFASGWNFGGQMPQPPYQRMNIPRLNEKFFEEVLGIPPLG